MSQRRSGGGVVEGRSGGGILLVEDNADASEMLRMVLESRGFGVDVASTGKAAIDQVHKGTYPVAAIVDIGRTSMPQKYRGLV